MSNPTSHAEAVADTLHAINRAWLERRPRDVGPFIHDSFVMVFPDFGGRSAGREAAVTGFEEFCTQATVREFFEHDHQVDVIGRTAVASFAFEMTYERAGRVYRSTGRDVWVFERAGEPWLAVWRTMVELSDVEVRA